MKLIFLNVWNFKNREILEDLICEHIHDTDAFLFQEAYEKTKWICKDLLKEYQLFFDYRYLHDKDDFPQASYIRKGIEVLASKTLLSDVPSAGLALYSKVKTSGKIIHLCNVHGVSKPGNKLDDDTRLSQSGRIIEEFRDVQEPIIIGGDFNLEFSTRSIQMFEENGYRNLVKEFSIPTTRNHFAWDLYPDNKQLFSDYAFVKGSLEVTGFSVPDTEASDHLPLILNINI